jgi:UDP-glucose 4-epimerase
MRALITGGAGFIGSHLADLLLSQGHSVIALDNLSTGRHANIEHLQGRQDFEFVLGSILNADLVDDCVSRSDVVFHRLGEEDDRILGSPLKSRWSYSEAKAIEEILAYTYYKQKGLPSVIVRLFNTVGPRQTGHYGMVIPRFVSQAVRGEAVTVYGDGSQTRCFCYVGDVVRALLALVEHPEAVGRVFNIGGQGEVSIEALAQRVISLAGSDSKLRYVPYEEAYEEGFEDMQRRVPDTTRARELIGFEPTADLDEIIQMVIDYQRS